MGKQNYLCQHKEPTLIHFDIQEEMKFLFDYEVSRLIQISRKAYLYSLTIFRRRYNYMCMINNFVRVIK